jgi:1,4-alpha-glucan branching enzyme
MCKIDLVNKMKNNNVTFSFKSTEARKVILIGDFNNWNPQKHPMKKKWNEMWWNGTWEKTVMLPPGQYEYKFLVDGEWTIDPQNIQTSQNDFGALNSILNLS